jgi:hypothetical protein
MRKGPDQSERGVDALPGGRLALLGVAESGGNAVGELRRGRTAVQVAKEPYGRPQGVEEREARAALLQMVAYTTPEVRLDVFVEVVRGYVTGVGAPDVGVSPEDAE